MENKRLGKLSTRACVSCARAKAKCIRDNEPEGRCQRCSRLQKRCEPSPPRNRGLPRKRKGTDPGRVTKIHVEKLEEKLDGLVNLLRINREAEEAGKLPMPAHHVEVDGSNQAMHSISISGSTPDPAHQELCGLQQHVIPRSQNQSTEPHVGQPAVETDYTVSPTNGSCEIGNEEANSILTIFRDEISPAFPFIVIHESKTAQDLRRDRPFLLLSILAVASRNGVQQIELGKLVIKQMAERIFVNVERNMDLLLGILTYAGWCIYNFFNIPQMTSLISAATTLVYDLGLSRAMRKEPLSIYEIAMRTGCGTRKIPAFTRTLEEQRALLGCFHLSYAVSSFFRRSDPLPHTPYIDQCCGDLLDVGIHTNDRYAVALVKLQAISQRIDQAPWNVRSDVLASPCPPMLFIKAVEEQLQKFKQDLSTEMSENVNLCLSFHAVEVSLYKVGFSKSPPAIFSDDHDFERLELLHACLQSLKRFFDIFDGIPVSEYHCIAVPLFANLTHSHMALQALSCFEHSDWNLEYSRQTLDFSKVILKFADRLEAAAIALGLDKYLPEGRDIFSSCAKKGRAVEEYCRGRMISKAPTEEPPQPQDMELPDFTNAAMEYPMDCFDEAMLNDILGPFGHQGVFF